MGGNVETGSSKSASANPNVDPTVSMLMKGLQKQYGEGTAVYNKSLYPGVSNQTHAAWNAGTDDANSLLKGGGFNSQQSGAMGTMGKVGAGYGQLGANGGFNSQQQGAMGSMGGLGDDYAGLSGAYDQDAPGYQRMRQSLMDDAVTNVGSGFTSSGRFGGGSYIDKATESAVDAVAPLDYQNFQNDINNQYRSLDSQQGLFGQLFGMGQQGQQNRFNALAGQGGAASNLFGMGQQGIQNRQGAVGQLGSVAAARDAHALATRQGEHDLFRRIKDSGWDSLSRSSAILGQSAPAGGTQSSQSVPWWMAAGGLGATAAGAFF